MADNTALRSNILIALNWRSVQDGVAFFGWGVIFLERGSGSGLCPDSRDVADWCGFFIVCFGVVRG